MKYTQELDIAYEWLKNELWYHRYMYYTKHDPILNDIEYDCIEKLFGLIEDLRYKKCGFYDDNSPTQSAGIHPEREFNEATHKEMNIINPKT